MFKLTSLLYKGPKGGLKALAAGFVLLIGATAPLPAQVVPPATVPTPAESPCDPQYYESLKSRAWLEAQREITQNQNLIFKPDSVLEYTCFDQFANELARDASAMFSETTRWGTILPANSMDNALESLIGVAMRAYIAQNFNHSYLGGRTTQAKRLLSEPISGGDYNCDVMGRVWIGAKCWDAFHSGVHDGFYTLEQYRDFTAGNPAAPADHRWLPQACGSIKGLWAQNISQAYIDIPLPAQPPPAGGGFGLPATPGTPWTEDNVVTYLDRLNPANCGNTTGNQRVYPIATGIIVEAGTGSPSTYPEYVCIPPGCYNNPQGNGSPRCTRP